MKEGVFALYKGRAIKPMEHSPKQDADMDIFEEQTRKTFL